MTVGKFGRHIRRQPRFDVTHEGGVDLLGVLVADQAEAHLGARLGRQHGFEPFTSVAAGDAVHLRRGPRPERFERRGVGLAGRHREADIAEKAGVIEGQRLPLGANRVRQFGHVVVEAVERDPPGVVMQVGQHFRQHVDRVGRKPAIHARVQIAACRLHDHLFGKQPAQLSSDRWHTAVEQGGIADHRHVGLQLGGVRLHERHQRGRARFLLAFEEDGDLAGQLAVLGHPGAHRFDEGHQLALVVRGATPPDHFAVGQLFDRGGERIGVPQVQRVDRLHIIVAVEQEVRRAAAAMRHHHRVAGRVALGGVEADRGEIGHQPVGSGVAIAFVRRIGRDRGDLEQLHQPVEGGVEIGVEPGEDGGEGHRCLL